MGWVLKSGVMDWSSSWVTVGLAQLKTANQATLARGIARRGWDWPVTPMATGRWSVKPYFWMWQVAQEPSPFTERRRS